jgi:hypothetical protein
MFPEGPGIQRVRLEECQSSNSAYRERWVRDNLLEKRSHICLTFISEATPIQGRKNKFQFLKPLWSNHSDDTQI